VEPVTIKFAEAAVDLERCFPVMSELRTHLTLETFIAQVNRQQEADRYRLVYAETGDRIVSVAGFRITEFLAWGKILYVDDLVTLREMHGQGYGKALFDWLVQHARENACGELHLDSGAGPTRFRAHRFYLSRGMNITSHHFAMTLESQDRNPA